MFARSGRITAAAAVATACEASEALATAGETTTEAATYAPTYREDDDSRKDHEPDGAPSVRKGLARVNPGAGISFAREVGSVAHVLAVINLHTVVPT